MNAAAEKTVPRHGKMTFYRPTFRAPVLEAACLCGIHVAICKVPRGTNFSNGAVSHDNVASAYDGVLDTLQVPIMS
jgi:hypothetical protein